MSAEFMVVAYRSRRAFVRKQVDYAKRAETREEAEGIRSRLVEESSRYRLGWQYIDIRPIPTEEAA